MEMKTKKKSRLLFAIYTTNSHTGMHSSHKFKCRDCDYETTRTSSLERHQKHKDKKFQCSLCDYKTSWKNSIARHQKSVHLGQNIQCPDCNYEATRKKVA